MRRSSRLATLLFGLSVASPGSSFSQTPTVGATPAPAPVPGAPVTEAPEAPQATVPQAGGPQTQVYYHAGGWDAFSGRGGNGGPVCGIGTTNPVDNHTLSLRFDIGGDDTQFAASKPGWTIPDGTPISVVVQVGLNPPWTMRGIGRGRSIEWAMDRASIQDFDRQFRTAQSMTMSFPQGNEPPWTVSLAGSTMISNTFGRCIVDLTRQVQNAQPSAQGGAPPSAATQPFGTDPNPPPAR